MNDNLYKTPQSNVNPAPKQDQSRLGDPQSCSVGTGMNWVGDSWNLFKAQPGVWIGLFLVYMIVMMVLSWIPLVNFFSGIITPLFTAGWMVAAVNCDRDGSAKIDDLFAGFNRKTGDLIIVGLIAFGMEIALMAVLAALFIGMVGLNQMVNMVGDEQQMAQFIPYIMIFGLLFIALLLPIIMMIWYAPILIMQHDIKPWDAMTISFSGCLKNVLPLTVYSLVFFILILIGMLPLLLGLLIVSPMFMISIYSSYKDIYLKTSV